MAIVEERAQVRWTGRALIGSAEESRSRLLEALETGHPVEVDLSELVEADGTLIQLLVSSHVSATARGGEFRVTSHGYAFEQTLERYGLSHLLREPWVGGGTPVAFYFFEDET